jgi:hypothetical protein
MSNADSYGKYFYLSAGDLSIRAFIAPGRPSFLFLSGLETVDDRVTKGNAWTNSSRVAQQHRFPQGILQAMTVPSAGSLNHQDKPPSRAEQRYTSPDQSA